MANLVLATPILSDAATLAAGPSAAALPVTNLQTMQPGQVWRATDLASVYVTADLGAAAAITLIALLSTNASSTGTWRARAAASAAAVTSSPAYDSGSVALWATAGLSNWPRTDAILMPAAAQTYRYWRIDVSDGSNPAGYFDAGRLYLSAAWQPTINISFGWSLRWVDDSPIQRSVGGQAYPLRREPRRVLDCRLDFLSEAEMYANAFEIDRRRGRARDVLAIRDPADTAHRQQQTVYGLQQDTPPIVNPNFDIFSKRILVEELLP